MDLSFLRLWVPSSTACLTFKALTLPSVFACGAIMVESPTSFSFPVNSTRIDEFQDPPASLLASLLLTQSVLYLAAPILSSTVI